MSKSEKPVLNLWAEPQRPIKKMRLAVRLWALFVLAVSFQIWHYAGSWGALGGALLVEINLDIFNIQDLIHGLKDKKVIYG